jgi:hypothetical protein
MICTSHQIPYYSGYKIKKKDGRVMWPIWDIGEAHTGFWWGDLIERDNLEDLRLDVTITLKWAFKKRVGELWNGFIWFRIGTSVGAGECGNKLTCSVICGENIDP